MRETVDAEGRTRLRDRYVITAPVAAMARRLQLEPGDAIEAGQVLVVLDPVTAPTLDTRSRAEAVARLAAARARLRRRARGDARGGAEREHLRAEADRLAELLHAATGRRRWMPSRSHREPARRARGRKRAVPRGHGRGTK